MNINELKQLIRKVLEESFQAESQASDDAHRQNLISKGWGRWADKTGKITHVTQGGKLVAKDKVSKNAPTSKMSAKSAPQNSSAETVRTKLTDYYDSENISDDQYAGVYDMEKLVTRKPPKTKQELAKYYDKITAHGDRRDKSDDWFSGVHDFMQAYEKTLSTPQKSAQKSATETVRAKLTDYYDSEDVSDDQYAGVYDMEEFVAKKPPKTKQELKKYYDKITNQGYEDDRSDDWFSGVHDFMQAYEKTLKQ
jgi:hypothetical protein